MAKKDNDNFDFETEAEGKGKLDIAQFFKNLTKKQKGIILATVVGVLVVIAIVVTCVLVGTGNNNNNGDNGGNINNGENNNEIPDEVADFYISSSPTKTVYYVGDVADYSGLIVYIDGKGDEDMTIVYNVNPELFTITGFDSSAPVEEQIITVDVGGHTATFTVEIKAIDTTNPILQSITVVPPIKTTYAKGMPLDLAGSSIEAHYSNGETVTVTLKMSNISGYSAIARTPGEHEITVVYTDEFGGYAETTFTVTITE
ncbi:MAG: bacterial Ig-like domain-containing protein [Clostridia bacterium]|nr:bacterial Ig-like domain-containing protein [Clostridia bacterium]